MSYTTLRVCETFLSIQGESAYAGLPCFFIRLTGCNLRCTYCDTRYAYEEGSDVGIDELLEKTRAAGVGLVEVTGGEPLIQKGSLQLISRLCDEGLTVLVETNGSENIDQVDSRAVVILDIKTPGSGFSGMIDLENLSRLKPKDEVKFVITGKEDFEWTVELLRRYGLYGGRVLLSPASRFLTAEELAGWIIKNRLNVRLNLQIHRYIFGERKGA